LTDPPTKAARINARWQLFWSALTCQRFDRLRPVATTVELSYSSFGVKPPQTKAVTGHRTPKKARFIQEI
jgi:hypothetical protein